MAKLEIHLTYDAETGELQTRFPENRLIEVLGVLSVAGEQALRKLFHRGQEHQGRIVPPGMVTFPLNRVAKS